MGAIFQLASGAINSVAIQQRGEAQLGEVAAQELATRKHIINTEMQEVDAFERGQREVGAARMQTSQLIAKQRLAYTAAGVDADVGTAADTQEATRMLGELDAQKLKNNAMREAWGHRKERERSYDQLQALKGKAAAIREGTLLATIGNFVGTAGSTYQSGMSSGFGGGGGG